MYGRTVTAQIDPLVRDDALALQEYMVALIRAFGLHQPDRTPCGTAIPVSEAHALMELSHSSHLAQHELAERLGLEKSTVSRIVTQLHQRSWLRREQQEQDARVSLLSLTPQGRQAAAELAAARSDRFARLLEAIPLEQRATILTSLSRLVEAIRADS